jgi:cell division protein FtsI/penicillin-binding protein 2
VFKRRLQVLIVVFSLALVAIVARLVQLQVVQADYYRLRSEATLLAEPESLPFVRGSILDRDGRALVFDAPSWEVRVDYSVLALEAHHLRNHVRRWHRGKRYPEARSAAEVEVAFLAELDTMWAELEAFARRRDPRQPVDLRAAARDVHARVRTVRDIVARHRGFEADVAEERTAHAILDNLTHADQVAAREQFARYPWIRVTPASQRTFVADAAPFAHLLGRLGRVDRADVAEDPNLADPHSRYLADELKGKAGVERAAESTLRGRRGRLRRDREGNRLAEECFDAVDGHDVSLTISSELQRRLYDVLEDELHGRDDMPGGAIVVLDVQTREVLALVSYPSYDPSRFSETYAGLRDDTVGLPLRFRAVQSREAPGSIVKPLACLAGMMGGKITPHSTDHCDGYLFAEHRDRWRCWEIHGTDRRMAHGDIDVVAALRGSCNIFMYRLGERMGVDALAQAFDMVGFGHTTGLGLAEESRGINPTPAYLSEELNRPVTTAHARLFAIGQGELAITPVQAANLVATYAAGRHRPLTLIRGGEATPEWQLPATADQWAAIRRGMYEVVNNRAGTAYNHAHFEHDRYALCGKTGSATVYARPTSYRVPYTENGVEGFAVIPESARRPAIERLTAERPLAVVDPKNVKPLSYCPPIDMGADRDRTRFAHAWFAGFLQPIDDAGRPQWSREPRIAFSLLIEFGGSGGRTAGPVAKRVSSVILETMSDELGL